MIGNPPISENGIDKPKTGVPEDVIGLIGEIGDSLSPDQAARVEQLVHEGMLRDFAREAVLAKRPRKQT